MARTVEELLAAARARIRRYEPAEALAALRAGAVIVDIRSSDVRARDGVVPGSVHVPRTVLEWRLDPHSQWRTEYVDAGTADVILLCDHGYSSSLAAAALADLGLASVGDVIGGFEAWRRNGLPTTRARSDVHPRLPGMGPPD
jgi:rhodanese-related sulfurtransferase